MKEILFGDNNHDPINDKEYDHEDYTITSEYQILINRIKNEYVKEIAKKSISD